jgi:hypothetical protein
MVYSGQKQRDYQMQRYRANRQFFMAGASCAKCGGTDDLEADHIDRSTKISHKIWLRSRPRIAEELTKCQWLCKNCHHDKSTEERGFVKATHGTYAMYSHHGCRCVECKATASAKRQAQRQRDAESINKRRRDQYANNRQQKAVG